MTGLVGQLAKQMPVALEEVTVAESQSPLLRNSGLLLGYIKKEHQKGIK